MSCRRLHSKPFVGFSSANKCPVKRLRSASLSDHDASSVSVEAEKRQSAALDSPKREIQKSLEPVTCLPRSCLRLPKSGAQKEVLGRPATGTNMVYKHWKIQIITIRRRRMHLKSLVYRWFMSHQVTLNRFGSVLCQRVYLFCCNNFLECNHVMWPSVRDSHKT